MTTRRINAIWFALLLATAITWAWGENAQGIHPSTEWISACMVLGLAAFKGVLIALDYMELRHAPALWRRLVLGWLVLMVTLLLALSTWHALRYTA